MFGVDGERFDSSDTHHWKMIPAGPGAVSNTDGACGLAVQLRLLPPWIVTQAGPGTALKAEGAYGPGVRFTINPPMEREPARGRHSLLRSRGFNGPVGQDHHVPSFMAKWRTQTAHHHKMTHAWRVNRQGDGAAWNADGRFCAAARIRLSPPSTPVWPNRQRQPAQNRKICRFESCHGDQQMTGLDDRIEPH